MAGFIDLRGFPSIAILTKESIREILGSISLRLLLEMVKVFML